MRKDQHMKRSTDNGNGFPAEAAHTAATATNTVWADLVSAAANTASASFDEGDRTVEFTGATATDMVTTNLVLQAPEAGGADAPAAEPVGNSGRKAPGKRGPKSKARIELDVDLLMKAAGIRTVKEFARRAKVSRQTVYSWKSKGLTYWKADELAIKLVGLHPASVFGSVWWELDSKQVTVAA